jgi:hypothetical protein
MAPVVSRQPLTGEGPFLFQARSCVKVVHKMTLIQAILRVLLFSTAIVTLTIFHTIDYRRYIHVLLAITV